MKGETPLSASKMAKDKIRPPAIKVGIHLQPGQRFGFHNFRHSLATFLIRAKTQKQSKSCCARRKWSRGRDLNSRPADYEMSGFPLSLFLSIAGTLPLSPPFAPFHQSNVQRNVQRGSLAHPAET
jgi:hypothetical protein